MNLETNKNLENLVYTILQEENLESPSKNFNAKLMNEIYNLKASQSIRYKPLISITGWICIIGMVLLFTILSFKVESQNTSLQNAFNFLNTHIFSSIKFNWLSISTESSYAIFIFTIILLIQISLLKKYFNNKLFY